MKPYSSNENYGHDFEDIESVAVTSKKATRQRAKKDIKKESLFENSCPHCGSIYIFHFYTKDYSYCNDCEFEYPLSY